MASAKRINFSTFAFILVLVISSTSAQIFGIDLTEIFSNIGHGIRSVVNGDRVTLQGSSGPTNPGNGYRLVSRDPRDIKYFLFHKRLDPNHYTEVFVGSTRCQSIAGYIGQYIEQKTKEKLGRITGLDPAGPMFTRVPNDGRLDKSDADFVDVIHSSRLGLFEDIGHIDFYPNGGRYQFNCIKLSDYDNPFQTFRSFARSLSGAAGSCGHSRAPEYYTYSIRQGPNKITACKCESWREFLNTCKADCKDKVTLGEYCPPTARGKYFLEINVPDNYDR